MGWLPPPSGCQAPKGLIAGACGRLWIRAGPLPCRGSPAEGAAGPELVPSSLQKRAHHTLQKPGEGADWEGPRRLQPLVVSPPAPLLRAEPAGPHPGDYLLTLREWGGVADLGRGLAGRSRGSSSPQWPLPAQGALLAPSPGLRFLWPLTPLLLLTRLCREHPVPSESLSQTSWEKRRGRRGRNFQGVGAGVGRQK